ncbi:MAG: hypothetical protein ABL901_14000 [Hyphomicrobiaceae bacterium]
MRRLVRAVLGVLLGFACGAAAGLLAISLLSGNTHDKSLEMTMTAFFVTGPLGAVIGLIAGLRSRIGGSTSTAKK